MRIPKLVVPGVLAILTAAAIGMSVAPRQGSIPAYHAPRVAYEDSPAAEMARIQAEIDAQRWREAVWANAVWDNQVRVWTWTVAVNAHQAELEAQRAAAATAATAQRRTSTSTGGGSAVGGSCGVPPDNGDPPPGFPDYVIDRESSGNRDASNGSHFGRAQISCQHYQPGRACVGMSYSECWALLWNGGAGASNWEQTIG